MREGRMREGRMRAGQMRAGQMREGHMREGECSMGFIGCFRVMERPWPGVRDGRHARFAVRRRDREPGCRL